MPDHAAGTDDRRVPGLTRRGFAILSVGTGFALAVMPVAAETTISTGTDGLVAGPVTIPAADGEIPGYRARPEGDGTFPVILVVHEIFGVHEHIADVCRRLAHLGYYAIAPELFVRQGDVTAMREIDEILSDVVNHVPDAQVMADLDAAAAFALQDGGRPERLAVTGFCWGGRIAWLYAAHNRDLTAAIAWYGRVSGDPSPLQPHHPVDLAEALHAPVLGLYGGEDDGIPSETVMELQRQAQLAGNRVELVVYPKAGHAFFADYRPSYRPEAATDAWQRLQDWLLQHGV